MTGRLVFTPHHAHTSSVQINGEIFEHLNRKVIQIYGVNLTANKYAHISIHMFA